MTTRWCSAPPTSSRRDGDSVDYRFVNVFHIRDGKVTEAWGMAENDAETDAFFDKLAPA